MAAMNPVAHGAERDGAVNAPIPIKLGRELHTQMKTAASARRLSLKQLVHDVLGAWVAADKNHVVREVTKDMFKGFLKNPKQRARAKSKK
jgi:hypothetical protein